MKAKATIENRSLKAEVKYPLVGGAKLKLGTVGVRLKAFIKVPFLFSAKVLGIYKPKKEDKKK